MTIHAVSAIQKTLHTHSITKHRFRSILHFEDPSTACEAEELLCYLPLPSLPLTLHVSHKQITLNNMMTTKESLELEWREEREFHSLKKKLYVPVKCVLK